MAAFGAFVNLEDGVDGLVHVSQIADRHVAKPEDELSVGQSITVKVTDVDEENKKISLSKKLADAELYGDAYDDYDDDYDDDDYYDDENTSGEQEASAAAAGEPATDEPASEAAAEEAEEGNKE
jgi:predicted RNA-binding protein with RPS1 domain